MTVPVRAARLARAEAEAPLRGDQSAYLHAARPRESKMKLDEREYGVLAFVDDSGRIWAQCALSSPYSSDYVIEGPLSGFVSEEGAFTTESEQEFREWLSDRLLHDELFHVKDREAAVEITQRIAEAAARILKDREAP
jgi:hypothetical protein